MTLSLEVLRSFEAITILITIPFYAKLTYGWRGKEVLKGFIEF